MESAHAFEKRYDENINSIKMDLERNHCIKHSKNIRNFIFSRRNFDSCQFNTNKNDFGKNKFEETFNTDLINNNISEVISIFGKIHQNGTISLNKIEINKIKSLLLDYLKQIRKELIKENISIIQAKNIFISNNTKIFCELLINPINDTFDPFIQLESLWIINNIIFLVAKFKDIILFDVSDITKLLIDYLISICKNQKNDGVKYTLVEKILRIFGNLLFINNNFLKLLIDYEIIPFIIGSLHSSITSFRSTCLWIINKIILIIKKLGNNDLISYFTTRTAISNYKLILSRAQNQNSLDEISELFWIFNELVKYNSTILIPIFFVGDNNTNNGVLNLNKEYIINKFQFILDNFVTNKMLQPCFRLISNLLVICYKDIKDEELLSKLIENLFSKQAIFQFINEFMLSDNNKFDISLIEDILLLIFNLVSLSPDKSSIFFKNGIIKLITSSQYQNIIKIMKLLLLIYYKILKNNSFNFEPNDENVIKFCLCLMEGFKDDNSILLIFIDIFYFYLKTSNIPIEGNIENELNIFINTNENIPNNNLLSLLANLSNFIKMKFSSI
jgi:hypothetical protein